MIKAVGKNKVVYACEQRYAGKIRRKQLRATFCNISPLSSSLPRQSLDCMQNDTDPRQIVKSCAAKTYC